MFLALVPSSVQVSNMPRKDGLSSTKKIESYCLGSEITNANVYIM